MLLLGPRAVADVVAVLRGRADAAITRQRSLAGMGVGVSAAPKGSGKVLAHALLSLALWLPAVLLLGVFILALIRGLLYGLFVGGPYTDAWGGPTRAGAWAAHAVVALPLLGVVGVGALGLAALHTRVTHRLLGAGGSRWPIPVALLAGTVALLLVLLVWPKQL